MAWLHDGEKMSKICLFVLTECMNVTVTHTDTKTPHDGIGRACIASRGKNRLRLAMVIDSLLQRFMDHS